MACRLVRAFVVVCRRRFRCAFLLSLSLGSFRQLLDASGAMANEVFEGLGWLSAMDAPTINCHASIYFVLLVPTGSGGNVLFVSGGGEILSGGPPGCGIYVCYPFVGRPVGDNGAGSSSSGADGQAEVLPREG